MPEKFQFDFRKPEDQVRFDNAPDEEKENLISETHREALEIKERLDKGEAESYEEAFLQSQEEKLRKEMESLRLAKEWDKCRLLEKKVNELSFASDAFRYINQLESEPRDIPNYIWNIRRIVRADSLKHYSDSALKKIFKYVHIFLESNSSTEDKIKLLEACPSSLKGEFLESQKESTVKTGQSELYFKICDISKTQPNAVELTTLAVNALNSGSFYDVEKLVSFLDKDTKNILLEKMHPIKEEKIKLALEKKEKMPDGFETNGLMSHVTDISNLEKILADGILSPVEQYKKYGRRNILFDPVQQANVGRNGFISVNDYWYGARSTPDYLIRKTELLEKIQQVLKRYRSYETRKDRGRPLSPQKKEELADNFLSYRGSYGSYGEYYSKEEYNVFFESAIHPKWTDAMIEMNKIFEEYSEVILDRNKEKPKRFFCNSENECHEKLVSSYEVVELNQPTEVALIIDPKLRRYNVFNCAFRGGGESLVKKEIKPEDIIGIAISNSKLNEYFKTDVLKLAERFGVPLYLVESAKEEMSARHVKEIWPATE